MFGKLLARRKVKQQASRDSLDLYNQLVIQARSPHFYLPPFGVEDTVEGRFELILIHLFIVDHWLSAEDQNILLRRTLRETLVTDMDRSLREMGIGDMSVGKQMKQVGSALLGRLQSYKTACELGHEDAETKSKLAEVLTRNINGYENIQAGMPLAGYMITQIKALSAIGFAKRQPQDKLFTNTMK